MLIPDINSKMSQKSQIIFSSLKKIGIKVLNKISNLEQQKAFFSFKSLESYESDLRDYFLRLVKTSYKDENVFFQLEENQSQESFFFFSTDGFSNLRFSTGPCAILGAYFQNGKLEDFVLIDVLSRNVFWLNKYKKFCLNGNPIVERANFSPTVILTNDGGEDLLDHLKNQFYNPEKQLPVFIRALGTTYLSIINVIRGYAKGVALGNLSFLDEKLVLQIGRYAKYQIIKLDSGIIFCQNQKTEEQLEKRDF